MRFDKPEPIADMPAKYLNKIEAVVKSAVEESMQGAAGELHQADNTTPSVPDCIDIPVSFDISWKIRGFLSNLGFGTAISASTKKILDHPQFNRICKKCSRWSATRNGNSSRNIRGSMIATKQTAQSTIPDRASLWNQLLLR